MEFDFIRGKGRGLENVMEQMAVARREVGSLEDMDTICAEPVEVRWVSFGVSVGCEGAWEEVVE